MQQALSTVLLTLIAASAAESAPKPQSPSVGPLKRLREGNVRFATAKPLHPHESLDRRHELEDEQPTSAGVLGCSDSPAHVFNQGVGDLFVVLEAENIVDNDVTASVEKVKVVGAVYDMHTGEVVFTERPKLGLLQLTSC